MKTRSKIRTVVFGSREQFGNSRKRPFSPNRLELRVRMGKDPTTVPEAELAMAAMVALEDYCEENSLMMPKGDVTVRGLNGRALTTLWIGCSATERGSGTRSRRAATQS